MHRFLVSNGSARTRRSGPAARRRAAVMVGMLAAALAAAVLPAVPAAAATVTLTATIPVGITPNAVGVDPSTDTVYVTNRNSGDGTVSVIDGATNTVTATIPLPSASNQPDAVGVDPSTDTIYVATKTTVAVIAGATNTVADPDPISLVTGTHPVGLGVDPATDTIYVANGSATNPNTVWVINGATNTLDPTPITVGTAPVGVAVDPATNRIYVANSGSDNVSVINGATDTVTATIPTGSGSGPDAVAVDPATDTVYVTDPSTGTGNKVSVINGATNTVTATVTVGAEPQAVGVDPSTDAIYVANTSDNDVSVIDGATDTVVATINVGNGPGGVGVDPATHDAYVANTLDNTVSVIHSDSDLAIAPPANVTTDATGPSGATVSYPAPVVTDPDDTHPPHASCSPASGTVFPIGTTTVHCSATDTDDIPSTVKTSFTVTVKGAAAQLADLAKAVRGSGQFANGLTPLVAKAQGQLAAGQTQAACLTLGMFIVLVDTKVPYVFLPNAAALAAAAAQITAVLGCRSGRF